MLNVDPESIIVQVGMVATGTVIWGCFCRLVKLNENSQSVSSYDACFELGCWELNFFTYISLTSCLTTFLLDLPGIKYSYIFVF